MTSGKPSDSRPSGSAMRRAMLVASGMLAGMFLALIRRSTTHMERALSRELSGLRRRLLGIYRGEIVRTLGPPRTAVLTQGAGIPGALLEATETWYYPMSGRVALVIGFRGNVAQRIEFLNVTPHAVSSPMP